MSDRILIAVDAFGGDYAPHEIVKGAYEAATQYDIDIALVGQKNALKMLERHYTKKPLFTIFNAEQVIGFNEHPVQAIRTKPDSSIVVGVNLVKNGIASAFVSAGNTGAVLGATYFNLKKLEHIERPALCGIIQINPRSPVLLIDAGANVDCRPAFIAQFGELGSIFARQVLSIDSPRIALLNVGEEEIKGNALVKESHKLLKESSLNFIGNIEGHDILRGKTDVVVTDGFIGNILLKTMEGFGEFFQDLLQPENALKISQSINGPALIRYTELISKARYMDYAEYGGACLLGINGNIVVAHGRSHSTAIKNAIHLAYQTSKANLVEHIQNTKMPLKKQ